MSRWGFRAFPSHFREGGRNVMSCAGSRERSCLLPIFAEEILGLWLQGFFRHGSELTASNIRQGKSKYNPQSRKHADNIHGKGQSCRIGDSAEYCYPDGAHTYSKAQQQTRSQTDVMRQKPSPRKPL